MAEVDLGKLCHTVLERLVARLVEEQRPLSDMENDEITRYVDELAAQVVPELAAEMVLGDARNRYLLDRSRGHLARIARWQRDAARVGRFQSRWVEFPFGYDEQNRLMLRTPAGRTIYLRGRIDRVDVAELGNELVGLVLDYKRTKDKRLDLAQVYHGLTLQLVGYLLALQQMGASLAGRPIRPVAALYLPLLEPFQRVHHPSEDPKSAVRMRGIVDLSAIEALDESVVPGKASQFVNVRINQKGGPDQRCDLADRGDLARVVAHAGRKMGELADSLLDGEIAVSPYRLNRNTPCGWCRYRPICRHEPLLETPRALDPMKRHEVFARLAKGDAR
jgi:ATP-dependent helicase/nuclease subunit B